MTATDPTVPGESPQTPATGPIDPPSTWSIAVAETPNGRRVVALVDTIYGRMAFPLVPDAAEQLGRALKRASDQARSGLVLANAVPPAPFPVHRGRQTIPGI